MGGVFLLLSVFGLTVSKNFIRPFSIEGKIKSFLKRCIPCGEM